MKGWNAADAWRAAAARLGLPDWAAIPLICVAILSTIIIVLSLRRGWHPKLTSWRNIVAAPDMTPAPRPPSQGIARVAVNPDTVSESIVRHAAFGNLATPTHRNQGNYDARPLEARILPIVHLNELKVGEQVRTRVQFQKTQGEDGTMQLDLLADGIKVARKEVEVVGEGIQLVTLIWIPKTIPRSVRAILTAKTT